MTPTRGERLRVEHCITRTNVRGIHSHVTFLSTSVSTAYDLLTLTAFNEIKLLCAPFYNQNKFAFPPLHYPHIQIHYLCFKFVLMKNCDCRILEIFNLSCFVFRFIPDQILSFNVPSAFLNILLKD